jgi:hypothetical protein
MVRKASMVATVEIRVTNLINKDGMNQLAIIHQGSQAMQTSSFSKSEGENLV